MPYIPYIPYIDAVLVVYKDGAPFEVELQVRAPDETVGYTTIAKLPVTGVTQTLLPNTRAGGIVGLDVNIARVAISQEQI